MHPITGGSPYDTIIITSVDDIDRYSHRITAGCHELVLLDKTGCTSVGKINVIVCNFCYGYHYVALESTGRELSKDELGFDSLADAIMCVFNASSTELPVTRSEDA